MCVERADVGIHECALLGVYVNEGVHAGPEPAYGSSSACTRCKQCSNTLHSGAYRATAEPGVFVCSSHHPEAAPAGPTWQVLDPRQPRAGASDSKPPRTPGKALEANEHRDTGPKANTTPKGVAPTTADPRATNSSHVHTAKSSAGPLGGKASMRVANSSPRGWSSLLQDTTPSTPQGRVIPQVAAPQTKLRLGPASPGLADSPDGPPSASRAQQARENFFQTPGAAPCLGPAGRAPAPADVTSGDSSREQARSFLQKALPGPRDTGIQEPGRWVGAGAAKEGSRSVSSAGKWENEMGHKAPGGRQEGGMVDTLLGAATWHTLRIPDGVPEAVSSPRIVSGLGGAQHPGPCCTPDTHHTKLFSPSS